VKPTESVNTVGINNASPTEALDVTGNLLVSGTIKTADTTNSTSSITGSITTPGGIGVALDAHVGGTLTVASNITAENIIPENNNTHNLGTSALYYDNLYANRLNTTSIQPKAGSSLSITGTLTGSATSAGKLNSATTFRLEGEVSADSFSFDGQTGGLTKTLANSVIDPTFVTNKGALPSAIVGSDEFLVARGSNLYKTTQSDIIGSIQTIPIGTVTPYAGTTAPSGWLICNGDSYITTTYNLLFDVIGTTYGDAGGGTFRVPDLAGRHPVGLLGSPSNNNNRITSGTGTIGGVSGNPTSTIAESNLPDHTHSLDSDTGDQFYATTTIASQTGSNTSAGGGAADGANGTKISTTGSIPGATNTPLNTTDPFVAMNYIIYTGQII
jgi:microcystin-dependent protein/cytoskeletal protein CcmA (bactofilin family)